MSGSEWSSFLSAKCFDNNTAADISNGTGASDSSVSVALVERAPRSESRKSPEVTRTSRRKSRKKLVKSQSRLSTTHHPSRTANTTSGALLVNSPDRVLCSIFEMAKDIGTRVGVCIINYNTGELSISDFMDSQIYIRAIHKIQIHQPTEILLPSSSLNPVVSKLAAIIKFNVSESVKISEATNRYFNSQDGLNAIYKYLMADGQKKLKVDEIADKTFALSAAAAAVAYTEDVVMNKKNSSLTKFESFRMTYEATENTMLIDSKTIRGLELVDNVVEKNGLSFFKFLDCTCTKMGQRLLRNSILQPLTDRCSIELRLESVRELQNDPDLLDVLRSELRGFQDLDRLFAKLLSVNQSAVKSEQKINYSILLKSTIKTAKNIRRLLSEADLTARLLIETIDIFSCEAIFKIESYINNYINEDCTWASSNLELENQRSYAVKSGANGLLEISRQVYKNIIDQIIKHVEDLSEKYSINLDYAYESNHGFYIKIKRHDMRDLSTLPDVFINRSVKKTRIECTTLDIIKMNARLKEVMSEISLISEQMVEQLLTEVVTEISTLFMISEATSMLDLMCCFAHNANKHNYVIPAISDRVVFQNSRHPVLETLVENFVPNEILNTPYSSSVQIITGCNMSGKSVYLRQVVLLCIMAQMGSAVPADYACSKIYSKIHARVCSDSMEICSSNFCYEMKEIAQFLDDTDSSTLVILDELGRGSSIGDGFSISLAVTEYLLSVQCTVFLSTHFQYIPEILRYKPRVSHFHMKAELENDSSIKMHYQLSQEIKQFNNPGLRTVSRIFDPQIIKGAYKICDLLNAQKLASSGILEDDYDKEAAIQNVNQMKQIHNLIEVLYGVMEDSSEVSYQSLKALQEEFIKSFEQ